LCLDFCNTGQGARGTRGTEWITDFNDLIDWLQAAEAIGKAQATQLQRGAADTPESASRVWARAISFREGLFRVLVARTRGHAAAREDVALIEAENARTLPFARLSWTGERYAWSEDVAASTAEAALRPLVRSAVELLASEKLARLQRCGNSTCYWLFLDETRNHSRRWCEMASCGNLLKVRRFREKSRPVESNPAGRVK
jgi:predicted RNA-binding Zn ribbon-like protein